MNTKYIMIGIAALALGLGSLTLSPPLAQAVLPACATDGDADGDGFPDADDMAPYDDARTASSDIEGDTIFGVGDGVDDCAP